MQSSSSVPITGSKKLSFIIAIVFALAVCGVWTSTASAVNNDVVVFDIDGTLTNDAVSVTPHPGAVNAVKAYVAKKYAVVYVTGRPEALRLSTQAWLALYGFPSRPLYMAPIPYLTDASLIQYKTDVLKKLEVGTPEVRHAYGDSSTDFVAYHNVGVPQAKVWALKKVSTPTCESGIWNACLPNYT
ncbi:MAG: hypothetical protein JHC87_05990, partial [Thermoleophilaceae bacterium]|nr:hypothetical protein [Thermoleophilaceae bacterium]